MGQTKNIIIIGSAYPLRGGGIASFNERLAREFIRQGFNTTIYSFSLQYPGFLFPGKTQFSNEISPQDLKIKSIINSVNPVSWLKTGNEIKNLKPDIVVVRYWLPFMAPALGTILRRIKKNSFTQIICIADNIIPHEKRFADKFLTKYFIKPVDAFIAMSENVLNDLKVFTNKPTQLVSHPLYDNFGERISKDEARKKLGISAADKVILFFGFIRKYKGLDILLEAFSIARFKVEKLKLLIAGEFYDNRKSYDELIEVMGLQDDLILHTEFIPDSEIKFYLCAADCVIQPYRTATQSGVTPLALHFEKPVIVTNVGGLPSLVSETGIGLVAEPNAPDIAEKVVRYFNLGEDYFLPHLRVQKTKHTWDNIVQAILSLSNSR